MDIHQLSLSYVTEQDRILVRINTTASEEIRLWLTRRLTLNLWPAINHVVAEYAAQQAIATTPLVNADMHTKKMLAEFKKQETLQNANFKTPFRENPTTLPLGDKPLLVTNMDMAALPSGQLQVSIQGWVENQRAVRSFQLALDVTLIHAFTHLLEQALIKSEWAQVPGLSTLIKEALEASDISVPLDRPKYLN